MKPVWLIENWVRESSYLDLKTELEKQSIPHFEVRDIVWSDFDQFANKCVVFHGSIELTKAIKDYLIPRGAWPVAFMTDKNYLCTEYYPHFKEYLFNDRYSILELEDLCSIGGKFDHWANTGNYAEIFLRPNRGDKIFQAGLMDLQDIDRFYENNKQLANELVLISTPKNITGEWRFICSKEKIIAVSCYRFQSVIVKIPSAPPAATKLCEEILKVGWYPDEVFCVDICSDSDNNYWLLEINSFSSAGLYEAKKDLIVKEVNLIAEKMFKIKISNAS